MIGTVSDSSRLSKFICIVNLMVGIIRNRFAYSYFLRTETNCNDALGIMLFIERICFEFSQFKNI